MPQWIRAREEFRTAFVRGLFDTDGCVYVDTHRIHGREYKNMGMVFTNRCHPLLKEFKATLERIGLHPTQKTKYAVFLRRKGDIKLYFDLIGSSNEKHLNKVRNYFLTSQGGVA
jgi:intein/homing endonuclease